MIGAACRVTPVRGRYNGAAPFVNRFDTPSREGYAGFFYVGPVNASPPAMLNGTTGKSSASSDRPTP